MHTRPLAVITGCILGLFVLLGWATGLIGIRTGPDRRGDTDVRQRHGLRDRLAGGR